MSSPRILVLGAGALHKAHYDSIRAMGCFTIGMDRNAMAPARMKADAFCPSDPADVDLVFAAASTHRVDGILPLSEFGVVPAAIVSQRLGLKQIDVHTAQVAHDKLLMRQVWMRHGVEQPRFHCVWSEEQALRAADDLGYPLVIKPRALSASRAVQIAQTPEDLLPFYRLAANASDGVLVEEYVHAPEASVEGVVVDGTVRVLALGDRELRRHPTYRVTRAINYPSAFTLRQEQSIRACAQDVLDAVGLHNSPFNVEVFVAGDKILPIECAARGAGGHIFSHVPKLVSGVDLVQTAVQIVLGESPSIPDEITNKGACYRFLFPPHGKLVSVAGIQEATKDDNVVDLVLSVQPGTEIREPENGTQRGGFLLTKGAHRTEALNAADRAESRVRWNVLS